MLPALTGMRFFLAFWVVAYHQERAVEGLFQPASWLSDAIRSLLHTGYSAVGAFFILSGFVLSYNYDLEALRAGLGRRRFAVARFSRIYPAYLAGIVMLLPLAAYRLAIGLSIDSTGGLLSLILNLSLLQAWMPTAALTWNYPGWSLSDEAFFYAMLPLIGAYVYRAGRFSRSPEDHASAGRLGAAALGLWLCSLAVPLYTVFAHVHGFGDIKATTSEFQDGGWPGLVRYNPLLRLPEFCMGILLARIYRSIPGEHWLQNRGTWLYLPGIACGLLLLMNAGRIPYPPVHNGLLAPVFSLAILGFALGGGYLARLLSTPVLVFLGNASYSMYILHAPVSAWLKLVFTRAFLLPADGVGWFCCYLATVSAAACIFYRFVEEPMHQWLKRRLNAKA